MVEFRNPPALSGAILIALQTKGVKGEELAAMARVLLTKAYDDKATGQQAETIHHPQPVIDTCGTGGMGLLPLIYLQQWPLSVPPLG